MRRLRGQELNCSFDIVVLGTGFAGSLMAMIARRLGYSVALVERGTHPRVVIGESSTPLANLLLEDLCRRYALTSAAPLAKWGSWQRAYPRIGCGLKRGFTFYHHASKPSPRKGSIYDDQLMVAASPHNEIADTHWYRADFDLLLLEIAQEAGAAYFDLVQIETVRPQARGIELTGTRNGQDFLARAGFVIDATGPRGLLHQAFNLEEDSFPNFPSTQALYSHFSGVRTPDSGSAFEGAPYPPEEAAVHHVFDGGWVWVLRFNNGITSAGLAATDEVGARMGLAEGAASWERVVKSLPVLAEQFAGARAEQPFRYIPRLSFLSKQVCGERWASLPSAAGFVDPLLSTGFPLTLLGIERLSEVLASGLESPRLGKALSAYAGKTTSELLATARLVGALYATMDNFPLFRALCLLYFAAASFSETARRLGKPELAQSFLLHDHPHFGERSKTLIDRAIYTRTGSDTATLIEAILDVIAPIDVAALSRPSPRHWYPVRAEDLLDARDKVGATPHEIEQLLARCGFAQPQKG
jgi:tetracycline 7-halogenase / FADH2 O2-dependent halogenase